VLRAEQIIYSSAHWFALGRLQFRAGLRLDGQRLAHRSPFATTSWEGTA
jgi:hypothetical protein